MFYKRISDLNPLGKPRNHDWTSIDPIPVEGSEAYHEICYANNPSIDILSLNQTLLNPYVISSEVGEFLPELKSAFDQQIWSQTEDDSYSDYVDGYLKPTDPQKDYHTMLSTEYYAKSLWMQVSISKDKNEKPVCNPSKIQKYESKRLNGFNLISKSMSEISNFDELNAKFMKVNDLYSTDLNSKVIFTNEIDSESFKANVAEITEISAKSIDSKTLKASNSGKFDSLVGNEIYFNYGKFSNLYAGELSTENVLINGDTFVEFLDVDNAKIQNSTISNITANRIIADDAFFDELSCDTVSATNSDISILSTNKLWITGSSSAYGTVTVDELSSHNIDVFKKFEVKNLKIRKACIAEIFGANSNCIHGQLVKFKSNDISSDITLAGLPVINILATSDRSAPNDLYNDSSSNSSIIELKSYYNDEKKEPSPAGIILNSKDIEASDWNKYDEVAMNTNKLWYNYFFKWNTDASYQDYGGGLTSSIWYQPSDTKIKNSINNYHNVTSTNIFFYIPPSAWPIQLIQLNMSEGTTWNEKWGWKNLQKINKAITLIGKTKIAYGTDTSRTWNAKLLWTYTPINDNGMKSYHSYFGMAKGYNNSNFGSFGKVVAIVLKSVSKNNIGTYADSFVKLRLE